MTTVRGLDDLKLKRQMSSVLIPSREASMTVPFGKLTVRGLSSSSIPRSFAGGITTFILDSLFEIKKKTKLAQCMQVISFICVFLCLGIIREIKTNIYNNMHTY